MKKQYGKKRTESSYVYFRYTRSQLSLIHNKDFSLPELSKILDKPARLIQAVRFYKIRKMEEYNKQRNTEFKIANKQYKTKKGDYAKYTKAQERMILKRAFKDEELARKFEKSINSIRLKRFKLKRNKKYVKELLG